MASEYWLSDCLEPCCDVDAVAVDPGVVEHHIALVDANAKLHLPRRIDGRIALGHRLLDRHGTPDGAEHAGELSKDTVAGCVDNAAAVLTDHRKNDRLVCFQVSDGCFFVSSHESAIARDVSREDSSQSTTRCGHCCGIPNQR